MESSSCAPLTPGDSPSPCATLTRILPRVDPEGIVQAKYVIQDWVFERLRALGLIRITCAHASGCSTRDPCS
jgi:hypothetical protein